MLRILYLEDDPVDADLVLDLLREAGIEAETRRVDTLQAFREELVRDDYGLILCDFALPGVDPWEALRLARRIRPELPLIYISGTMGEDTATEMLKLGASDYVLKQRIQRLAPSVKRALQEAEDHRRRIRAEEALRGSEARLNAIISSAMDAVISIDEQQRIVLFNPAAVSIFGVRESEAIGQHINRFIPARFREAHVRHVEEFGRTGATRRRMGHLGALSGLRANGEEFPIEATISQAEVGGQKLYTVILRDVTQSKAAERALRASEERFRQLADAMPQIVWAARPDGVADYYNRKWYELTGINPGRSEDESWLGAVHPDDHQRCLQGWHRCVRTGEPYQVECRLKFSPEGQYRWTLARALPVRNEQGEIVRWFGTSTDIHELKETEAALARARNTLEETVAARTAQLVEANSNLQTFTYTAAHDLRSPLRAIKSFSAIALEEYGPRLDSVGKSYLERVAQAADQMERLLGDLLEYSKLTRAEIKLERIDLTQAVRDALALLETDIRAKKADVAVSDAMPSVRGHPATVALIITNFLSNAIKFVAPWKQPQVRIWAERTSGSDASQAPAIEGEETAHSSGAPAPRNSDSLVRLWVEDNGIGMASDDLAKLFIAFQRLHSKQAYPGTGLGLAIVHKAAARMGGRVGVESELGRGSRFWVELPPAD